MGQAEAPGFTTEDLMPVQDNLLIRCLKRSGSQVATDDGSFTAIIPNISMYSIAMYTGLMYVPVVA